MFAGVGIQGAAWLLSKHIRTAALPMGVYPPPPRNIETLACRGMRMRIATPWTVWPPSTGPWWFFPMVRSVASCPSTLEKGRLTVHNPANTKVAPYNRARHRTGSTSVRLASVCNFHSINSSSSFKGTRFHMPASRPKFPLAQARTGPDVTLRVHLGSLRPNRGLS